MKTPGRWSSVPTGGLQGDANGKKLHKQAKMSDKWECNINPLMFSKMDKMSDTFRGFKDFLPHLSRRSGVSRIRFHAQKIGQNGTYSECFTKPVSRFQKRTLWHRAGSGSAERSTARHTARLSLAWLGRARITGQGLAVQGAAEQGKARRKPVRASESKSERGSGIIGGNTRKTADGAKKALLCEPHGP